MQVPPYLFNSLDTVYKEAGSCKDIFRIVAKERGYSLEDFLSQMDSYKEVHKIDIPMLTINSVDDALCSYNNVPEEEIKKNKNIIHYKVNGGGHISYYEGAFRPRLFGFELASDYFGAHFAQTKNSVADERKGSNSTQDII